MLHQSYAGITHLVSAKADKLCLGRNLTDGLRQSCSVQIAGGFPGGKHDFQRLLPFHLSASHHKNLPEMTKNPLKISRFITHKKTRGQPGNPDARRVFFDQITAMAISFSSASAITFDRSTRSVFPASIARALQPEAIILSIVVVPTVGTSKRKS